MTDHKGKSNQNESKGGSLKACPEHSRRGEAAGVGHRQDFGELSRAAALDAATLRSTAAGGRRSVRGFITGSKRLWVIFIVAVVALIVVWLTVVRGGQETTSSLATFVAARGPLTISVLESGTIKAREQIILKNEVEGRTSIISLIPEGTRVKKGDLLVELDASTMADAQIDQEIRVQSAYAALIKAQESLAVVQNQAISDVNLAQLRLDFAIQDLDQYKAGRFPNEETAAKNKITLAQEELTRAQETLKWSRTLYEQKYISQTELQTDQLAVTRTQNNLTVAQNDLELLQNFTYHRNMAQYESDVRQAEFALERTERKAKADVIQAEADLKAKELEHKRQQDKFKKLEDQLAKAKVYAPVDGMVIYATSAQRGGGPFGDRREPLQEGVQVFERQELIYLPTAESAMAEVAIHESSLEKVREGLPAIITVDALPGKKFLGRVARIAPLPDARSMFMNPDLKIYNTQIYLEDNDSSLRTGMSCKAEVVVEQYQDAVYIPVQAVLRVGGKPTVYVVTEKVFEPRTVEIGLDNNRMVRILNGLDGGEVVLLTPPLKPATLEPTLVVAAEPNAAEGAAGSIEQRVRAKLEEANGTEATGQIAEQQIGSRPGQDLGPADQVGDTEPNTGGRRSARGGSGFSDLSPEERQKMKERFESMSPEERSKEIEKMKEKFQNVPAEQRQRRRQRQEGAPSGESRPTND